MVDQERDFLNVVNTDYGDVAPIMLPDRSQECVQLDKASRHPVAIRCDLRALTKSGWLRLLMLKDGQHASGVTTVNSLRMFAAGHLSLHNQSTFNPLP